MSQGPGEIPEQTSFHWVDVNDLAEAHIQAIVRGFYRPPDIQ